MIMSYSTKMWAVTTLLLVALVMFAGTRFPALGHAPQAHASAQLHQRLLPERNLHSDPSSRFKHTISAFGPFLALLFVTLVVLDSIALRRADHRLTTTERPRDLVVRPIIAANFADWPREFDLIADSQGWTAVRREPQFSQYGGN